VGRNPAGGFATSGELLADFVVNGAGSFGFWPCVTCACTKPGRKSAKAKTKMLRARMVMSFQKIRISFRFL
jgi:hypothetical protein